MQSLQVASLEAAVVLAMPQMQHAGGEAAFLAPHAGIEQPHREVGVLEAPALVGFVETVDGPEIVRPDAEIAGAHPLPATRGQFAQRPRSLAMTGRWRIPRAAIRPMHRSIGSPSLTVSGLGVMTSVTCVVPASRPGRKARIAQSPWDTIPVSRSESITRIARTRFCFISSSACLTVSEEETLMTRCAFLARQSLTVLIAVL